MNSKITFPRLASMLADDSGRSKRFSEDFLREFFSLISELLVAGDTVKVKGLGTFRVSRVEPRKSVDVSTGLPMEIAGHSKVVFIPSKEIADAVNAPFEAFPTVELDDNVDLSLLNLDEVPEQQNESEVTETIIESTVTDSEEFLSDESEELTSVAASPADDIEILQENIVSDEVASHESQETVSLTEEEIFIPAEDEVSSSEENMSAQEEKNIVDEEESAQEPEVFDNISSEECDSESDDVLREEERLNDRSRWRRGFFTGMLACLALIVVVGGAVAFIICPDKINTAITGVLSDNSEVPEQEEMASDATPAESPADFASLSTDSSAADEDNVAVVNEVRPSVVAENDVPTAPSDAVVYDTIGKTRYLTTMAKAHYGNYNLWPVIYEENKGKLGHPDRIRPGTPVIIPKLIKYGIDPSNKKDVEKIKNMGIEIYARYGKKI